MKSRYSYEEALRRIFKQSPRVFDLVGGGGMNPRAAAREQVPGSGINCIGVLEFSFISTFMKSILYGEYYEEKNPRCS